jgi:hypothetical protein
MTITHHSVEQPHIKRLTDQWLVKSTNSVAHL